MFEREVVFGEFLEAEDVCIFGCVFDPRSFFNEAGANLSPVRHQHSLSISLVVREGPYSGVFLIYYQAVRSLSVPIALL